MMGQSEKEAVTGKVIKDWTRAEWLDYLDGWAAQKFGLPATSYSGHFKAGYVAAACQHEGN